MLYTPGACRTSLDASRPHYCWLIMILFFKPRACFFCLLMLSSHNSGLGQSHTVAHSTPPRCVHREGKTNSQPTKATATATATAAAASSKTFYEASPTTRSSSHLLPLLCYYRLSNLLYPCTTATHSVRVSCRQRAGLRAPARRNSAPSYDTNTKNYADLARSTTPRSSKNVHKGAQHIPTKPLRCAQHKKRNHSFHIMPKTPTGTPRNPSPANLYPSVFSEFFNQSNQPLGQK